MAAMVTSTTTSATLSSLSLHSSPRFSLLPTSTATTISTRPTFSLSLSSSRSFIPKAADSGAGAGAGAADSDTFFFTNDDADEYDAVYSPPEAPEGFVAPPSFDDGPPETEDEIAAAYEELYGPAYSGVSVLGNDIYVMDSKVKKIGGFGSGVKKEKIRDGFEERVVQVRRVTKVVKGGKQLHFRAVVVVGDKKGQVGVGVGKAKEVIAAVQKSAVNARRNIITVPMTKYLTFPHRSEANYGAAKVMLRPASPGTGVIAGGTVRIVLEMAGVENALGKQLGSNNALNNARATVAAVQKMRQFQDVARERGIPMEELWK
ncbi:hypothetical protein TIFTF001_019926 [Ficus carica]|uniref:Small ribosomal subunit protein uS5c n=1 Tax=Ficus carica TaxID=3494 RepID=A0AA88A7K3_FICCA|nr:hypothetical protein TIFTF001_019926 [Ficus carica]